MREIEAKLCHGASRGFGAYQDLIREELEDLNVFWCYETVIPFGK